MPPPSSRLTRIDYTHVCRATSARASDRAADVWLRRVFEDAPLLVRWLLVIGWRVLGARLGPLRSPAHILGWRIDATEPTWVRLSVEWRIGLSADLVLSTDASTIAISTFVQLHNRGARWVWAALVPVHRLLLGYLLRRAADPLSGRRWILQVQRHIANPIARRAARYLPGEAVIETTGRRSGLPRRTPVGGRLDGPTFWIVSEFGRSSNYVRNLTADPAVRVRIGSTWHAGRATVVDDDDVRARLRQLPWLNSLLVRLVGSELLTIRVDLDAAAPSGP